MRADGATGAALERLLLRWGYITSPINPAVIGEFEAQGIQRFFGAQQDPVPISGVR